MISRIFATQCSITIHPTTPAGCGHRPPRKLSEKGAGAGPGGAEQSRANLARRATGFASVLARAGEPDDQVLEYGPGRQGGRAFQVEVGLEQQGGELVDPARAEVRVLAE